MWGYFGRKPKSTEIGNFGRNGLISAERGSFRPTYILSWHLISAKIYPLSAENNPLGRNDTESRKVSTASKTLSFGQNTERGPFRSYKFCLGWWEIGRHGRAAWWNISNQSQPNQGSPGDGPPCMFSREEFKTWFRRLLTVFCYPCSPKMWTENCQQTTKPSFKSLSDV